MEPAAVPLELAPATRDELPVLANLLELYAYDFSEVLDLRPGDDGRFGYARLPLYWQEPGRFPLLVRSGGLAGFALVKRGSEVSGDEAVWDMAEMFVLRSLRRRGLATRVACEVWRRFPGPWEVRVMEANAGALAFWPRAIATFLGRAVEPSRFERSGRGWSVFSFEARETR